MKRSRIFSVFSLFLLLTLLFGPGAQPAAAGDGGVIFTVTSANEGSDAALNGICATASGACTLRAALQEANFDPAVNTIYFNLPGGGVHVISISSGRLPEIGNALNLDGSSQPGCTVPCIALSGALLAGSNDGLVLAADNSMIKGFIITSWSDYGVVVGGSGNYIQANAIGIWPGNPSLLPNGGGIALLGTNNLIGGTTAAERNVISGNTVDGIVLGNGVMFTSNNTIRGNYIGTTQSGMAPRGNGGTGIVLTDGASYTTITGNVISANGGSGITIVGPHTTVRGNYIGTRADGTGSLGNQQEGIFVVGSSTANYIGGTTGSAKNKIAHNGRHGIMITPDGSGRTTIRRNSIFANGLRGIDLGNDGVTFNDTLDPDGGPNRLQNFPVVVSATSSSGAIVAKLFSEAGKTYTLEFFASPACDASSHGEGQTFLGSTSATTDGTGYVRVVFSSPIGFITGSAITATATDSTGRTSEFSRCRTAG